MRYLIVGDLHGHMPVIHAKKYDAIIAPGDFCSDALKSYMFEEVKLRLQNPKSQQRWYDLVGRAKARKMMAESLQDGRRILAQLNALGKPVYAVPGNWDWTPEHNAVWQPLAQDHFPQLIKGLKNVINVHQASVKSDGVTIIGSGIGAGPEYPQYPQDLARFTKSQLVKKKKQYERNYAFVAKLFDKASSPVIFLTHNVPFNTPLDQINNKESPRDGQHFGSLIARRIVDNYRPAVCIGGHMHEHFRSHKLGKTLCINAGFGADVNVLLDITGNKISSVTFWHKGKKKTYG